MLSTDIMLYSFFMLYCKLGVLVAPLIMLSCHFGLSNDYFVLTWFVMWSSYLIILLASCVTLFGEFIILVFSHDIMFCLQVVHDAHSYQIFIIFHIILLTQCCVRSNHHVVMSNRHSNDSI